MRFLSITLLIFATLFLGSCEKNTTNYYTNEPRGTTIEGTIVPADSGIVIAAASKVYQTTISAAGYYRFDDVEEGIYTITIIPANYNKRVYRNFAVAVEARNTVPAISVWGAPFPMFATMPADDEVSVALNSEITLFCDDFFDSASLASGITIEPPLEGRWKVVELEFPFFPRESEVVYTYARISDESDWLQFGQTYTVTIDSTMLLATGEKFGKTWSFQFTVIPLKYSISIGEPSLGGGVQIWKFIPRISFDRCVFADSLPMFLTFKPPIEGFWVAEEDGYCRSDETAAAFNFFPTDLPLPAGTDYILVVNTEVNVTGLGGLTKPDTVFFRTEEYGVISISPPNGKTSFQTYNDIILNFNIAADSLSVAENFSLTETGVGEVDGKFYWTAGNRKCRFEPTPGLKPFTAYHIFLSGNATDFEGRPFGRDINSYFSTSE